jgi:hypothetical protein
MTLRDFPSDFNKNLQRRLPKNFRRAAGQMMEQITGQVKSPQARQLLNSALDLVRPHFLSLGIRVTRLGTHDVEVLLPKKRRNLDEHGEFIPGILMSSATEAYRLLWVRNAPPGEFQMTVELVQFQSLKNPRGDVRVRFQLSDLAREARLAELSKNKISEHEGVLRLYDEEDQICAEVLVKSRLLLKEMLEWK